MTEAEATTPRWQSRARTGLWLAVLGVWLVGLFREDLFFPMQQAVAGGTLAVLSAGALALSWRHLRGLRPSLMDLGLALIAIAYIASMRAAVRPEAAALQATLVLVGLALFAAIRTGAFGRPGVLAVHLRLAIVAGAGLVTVGGLLASVGIVHMAEPTLGGMLTSTFTYHNSFAALALVGMVLALSGLAQGGRAWAIAMLAAVAAWLVVAIALSQSRGVWLVAPVALALWLLGLPGVSRGRAFLLLCGVLAAGAVGTPWMLSGLERDLPHHMLGGLALSGLAASGLVLGLDALWRYREHHARRAAFATAAGLALAAVVGGILLRSRLAHLVPSILAARASSLSLSDASVSQRIEILRIAFQLIRREPVTGYGGGAWLDLYHNLSSTFFSANETHSIVAQVLLEAGPLTGIGLAAAAVGAAIAMWRIRRSTTRLAAEAWGLGIALLALVSHAAFDWDLSYLSLAMIAWMLAGALLGSADTVQAQGTPAVVPATEGGSVRPLLGFLAPAAALSAALAGGLVCTSFALARSDLGKAQLALRAGHTLKAWRGARTSLAFDPWSTAAYATLADAAPTAGQRSALLAHAAVLSPDSPDAWSAYAEALLRAGRVRVALQASAHALRVGPWDVLAATAVARAADAALLAGGPQALRGDVAFADLAVELADQGTLIVPTGSRVAPSRAKAALDAALGEGDVLTDLPATGAQALEAAVAADPQFKPRLAPWLTRAAAHLQSSALAAQAATWRKPP